MRALRVLLVLLSAWTTTGCYIVSISGLADTSSTTFDEALLGHWKSAEDDVELLVARDEWQTYSVTMRDRTGEQRFTGRLTTIGDARFFDLTIHVGVEANPTLLPVHIIGRVGLDEGAMRVELLDYDWFRGRLGRGSLTTPAVLDERDTILLTAARQPLRKWLAANAGSPTLFAEAMLLKKEPEESR